MSNYKIISSQEEPVYVEASTAANAASAAGKFFSVTTGDQTIPSSGFLALQLTVPADIDKTIYIWRIAGGSQTTAVIDTYRNATFSGGTSGTSITPYPENWSYASGTTSVICQYLISASDPTSGGEPISTVVANGLVMASYDGRVIIPSSTSDRTFYVILRNKTNQTNVAAATLAYAELP